MQGKGLLKFFLILIAIVSAVQLLYFIPTNRVENAAEQYGELAASKVGEESKYVARKSAEAKYLDSMSSETLFDVPLLGSYTYNELKNRQVGLGLDLKGGMSAVMQVELKDLLISLAGSKKNDTDFQKALTQASEAQRSDDSDYITLFANAYSQIAPDKKMAKLFQRSASLDGINTETPNSDVVFKLREKANETVDLTFKMLKERIDRLGVVQPNVTLDPARDLILVEMPGVDNPQRMKENLERGANLEFWQTYRFNDPGIAAAFTEADRRTTKDGGEVEMEEVVESYVHDTITGAVIDSVMISQPKIKVDENSLLSKLTFNGSNNVGFYQVVMGIAKESDKKAVEEMLARPDVASLFPQNTKFAWSYKPYQNPETREPTEFYELYLLKKVPGSDKAPLEGDVIVDASQQIDPNTGEPEVSLAMDGNGAKIWAAMTSQAYNEGQREIAITLDDQVVSAPGVNNGAITGGRSSISGSFDIQEAIDFANILEVGKLPAKPKIIQQSVVGPSLGEKNIKSSILSLVAGFALLVLFMIFYYGGGGIVSILALFTNLFFIFGALGSFGTVLTLPGIAGIVLTIGMAVDANVIIFERIREELRLGKGNLAAIADGFKNSYSAIIDANVTTLLVAFVLSYYGLGPIKGFAVVLIIGVISSLITAVLFGRLLIDSYTDRGKEMSFWTSASKNAFANLNIDWIGKRKIAYVVSTVLIVAGLASIFTRGFNLGVDFQGGFSYDVQFEQDVDQEAIKSTLASADLFNSTPVVKTVDSDNTYQITTEYLINETADDVDERVAQKLHQGLSTLTGSNVSYKDFMTPDLEKGMHVVSSAKVGPTIADDITRSSYYAGIIALILIFVYILMRFSKWQYSLGAVAALFHDSLIVLGLFSLLKDIMPFSLQIDQAFIAAILTVIGYSINDTVVVFDRIREYLGIYTNKGKDEVLNMALNSTFSRTVITSITTLLVVTSLLLFGGGGIKGFAFALFIGILVGTYSSIFVATPIVRDFSGDLKKSSGDVSQNAKSKQKEAAAV